jgi:hypothetical protein
VSLTFRELQDSRDPRYGANGGGETLRYIAFRTDDQVEVFDTALLESPTVHDGFIRSDIRVEPRGGGVWRVEVEYAPFGLGGGDNPVGTTPINPTAPGGNGGSPGSGGDEALGPGYSFEIAAGTEHATQSKQTMFAFTADDSATSGIGLEVDGADDTKVDPTFDGVSPAAGDVGKRIRITGGTGGWTLGTYTITAVSVGVTWTLDRSPAVVGTTGGVWVLVGGAQDFKGAVGVTKDRVEGYDLFVPKFDWSRSVSREVVTRNYMRTLRELCGKKNDAPFYGSEAGEVLYLGASGSYTEGGKWAITHKFAEVANQTSIVIVPGELIVPSKRGWDYLWVAYKAGQGARQVVQEPSAAYVEEVVDDGDFSLIEIGY